MKKLVEAKKVDWDVVIGGIFTIFMILFGLHGPVLLVLSMANIWQPPGLLVVTSSLSIIFDVFFLASLS